MFDIVASTKYARRVLQHSIAIAELEAMREDASDSHAGIHTDFKALATAMGKLVYRTDDQSFYAVEIHAYDLFRSAVSAAALSKGAFNHAPALARMSAAFGIIANRLGYDVEPIDDDAARGESEAEAARPAAHASTSPGPVNCQQRLIAQGKTYAKSCERCGLGPCPFFDKDGNSLLHTSERSAAE